MTILITILGIIVALIAIILIVAAILPKSYVIENQATIARPVSDVFSFVRNMKNQEHYNKWVMMDPGMTKKFNGTDGTVGCVYSWESTDKNVGVGEQSITAIKENERIDMHLHFIKPFDGHSEAYFVTTDAGSNSTNLRWGFASTMKYPGNFMFYALGLKGKLTADLNESLGNMKKYLEQK